MRQHTPSELLTELQEADLYATAHEQAESIASNRDDKAYHWSRKAAAHLYAQLCREELKRRLS